MGGGLWARVVSSVILAPVALAAVYYGSPWFALLVAVATAGMTWEWGRLIGWTETGVEAALLIGLGAGTALVAGLLSPSGAVGLAVGATLAMYVLSRRAKRGPLWLAAGLVWILLPCAGLIWLRDDAEIGLATTIWMLALVWAVDIGAYVTGKSVGGPRLAPRISPTKTWSGLGGGVVGAAIVGLVAALVLEVPSPWVLVGASGVLALIEQIGDIAESYAKRRFGVKDSSDLIPGHGGILDRLDGMLAVAAAVVVFQIVTGESILLWH
ncbi:MAG TPA: phosphatidate cytidylyltransferase [Stellaceae bacterium]|nr:phosphatidate cytidylyltransferase [Stellaceae bacterium]